MPAHPHRQDFLEEKAASEPEQGPGVELFLGPWLSLALIPEHSCHGPAVDHLPFPQHLC